jgi:hypothetical protein
LHLLVEFATVHIDELQDCCETGLIVFGSGA